MKHYPTAVEAMGAAMAFDHDPEEVRAIAWILRSKTHLMPGLRRFAARFIPGPITIVHTPGAPSHFNHTKRIVQIGEFKLEILLHEFGHARYGTSEDLAVAYSLGLILKAKPGFVPLLDGHVLINNPCV
jgi:hypothetical protein